jgi:hypothetical protein
MVVGPEYNAIMGVALGIDQRAKQQVLRGRFVLLAGFSASQALVAVLSGRAASNGAIGVSNSQVTLGLAP